MKKWLVGLLVLAVVVGMATSAGADGIDLDGMTLEELGVLQRRVEARIAEIVDAARNEGGSLVRFTGYEVTKIPTENADGSAAITVMNCSTDLSIVGFEILMGGIDRFGDRVAGFSDKFYVNVSPGEATSLKVRLVRGEGITADILRAYKLLIGGDVVIWDGWDLRSDLNWLEIPRG